MPVILKDEEAIGEPSFLRNTVIIHRTSLTRVDFLILRLSQTPTELLKKSGRLLYIRKFLSITNPSASRMIISKIGISKRYITLVSSTLDIKKRALDRGTAAAGCMPTRSNLHLYKNYWDGITLCSKCGSLLYEPEPVPISEIVFYFPRKFLCSNSNS